MCTIEWKEVKPEEKDCEKQIDIVAYYGSFVVGSIIYRGKDVGWQSVIDGHMEFMESESMEEAKKEMMEVLNEYCTEQIDFYNEIKESLNELNSDFGGVM